MEFAKNKDIFDFAVIAIEPIDKGFNIRVLIEVPRVTEVSSGNIIYSLGIPKLEGNQKFLVHPKVPDFVTDGGEKWTYSGVKNNKHIQMWDDKLINRNQKALSYDEDCLAVNNTTQECDGYFTPVFTDFSLITVFRQQILLTFVECSLKIEGKPILKLSQGIHLIKEVGQLLCNSKLITLD